MSEQGVFGRWWRGVAAYLEGLAWLCRRPKYIVLLGFPLAAGFTTLIGSLWVTFLYVEVDSEFFNWPAPWTWLSEFWPLILPWLVRLGFVVGCLVLSFIVLNILAAPVYESISYAVERDVLGIKGDAEIGFWHSMKLVKEELKKSAFILMVSLLIWMIPGLNWLSPLVIAFGLGWGCFDIPLARRGWSFEQRLRFMKKYSWELSGFSLWLMVPVLQMLLLPFAIPGASLLAAEGLRQTGWQQGTGKKPLTPSGISI